MDRIDEYRTLVKNLLSYYADLIQNRWRAPTSDDETFVMFDEERDHYMIMTWGWEQEKYRVRDADVYIRITNSILFLLPSPC
ncbi:MAG: element excision factor XisI family protein, partial [Chloroflexota bacterium]